MRTVFHGPASIPSAADETRQRAVSVAVLLIIHNWFFTDLSTAAGG